MMAKGDRFAPRMFRRLLVPSLASSLGLALADMADAVVVGQRMGATGLAAIGLSLPLYMVFNVCMHGLGIGGSVRYSRLLGEGKAAAAVACFNRTMRAGLALGVLIALLVNLFPALVLRLLGTSPADGALFAASENYVRIIALGAPLFFASYMLGYFLRSDDQQKLASAGFLVGNGVDILLNLVFVLWLDGGTAGAAWATLLGLVATLACYAPGLVSRKRILRLRWPRAGAREVLACFRTGLATSSQYAFQMAFLLIANNALLRMAGENGVAVFDMVQNASYLILYLYEGTAKAAQPLVSTFYGEKNMVSARRTRSLSLFWGLVAGSVAAALVSAFPGAVCGVFGLRGAELTRLGARALRLFCLGSAFAGASILLETYFQSIEEERRAFIIALLRGCVVLLPVTFLFSFAPLEGFWWLYPANECLSLGLFGLYCRLTRGRGAAFDAARVFSRTIRGSGEEVTRMNEDIEAFCQRWNAQPRQRYFVTMATEEVCMAIIANALGQDGEIQVTLVALEEGDFELHIRDNAALFNPFSLQAERIGAELNVATQIQASMLPCIFPAFPSRREFDIYATMTPAKEVGGDFYDFFLVDDDHLALVMADVSGKGVPAALFMVIAKTLLKNAVQTGLGPKAALEKVNNQLCENNEAEMFVTVWLGVYEISSGKLVAANAGHEKPAILRADGKFELYSDKHGFVLAGMENTRYREYALQLEAGDALFVYTDGVAEATDARNTLYGTQRMLDALNRNPGAGPEALLRQVKADIDAFVGEAPQFDDITMLALKVKELPSGGMKRVSVAPDLASVAAVTEFVEACLAERDAPMKVVAQVNVAVDEIFSNIARYSGATAVSVGCEAQAGRVLLRFSDNGRPYDPTSKADPDVTLSAEERDAGGLGIFMVKKTMDRLAYEYEDGFNVLTLEKAW